MLKFPESKTSVEIAGYLARQTGCYSKRRHLWARWIVTRWGKKGAWWLATRLVFECKKDKIRDPGKFANYLFSIEVPRWLPDAEYERFKNVHFARNERYQRVIRKQVLGRLFEFEYTDYTAQSVREILESRQRRGLNQPSCPERQSDEDHPSHWTAHAESSPRSRSPKPSLPSFPSVAQAAPPPEEPNQHSSKVRAVAR